MRKTIGILLIAVELAACYTWQPQAVSPGRRPDLPTTPSHLRVHTRSGREIELFWATAHGDSVTGTLDRHGIVRDTTLAFDDLTAIHVAKADRAGLAFGLVGLALTVGVVATLVTLGEFSIW